MSNDALAAQLEARLLRERRARRQAEVIAERGMRELWDLNRHLSERVAARTAQIERVLAGAERAVAAWADELSAMAGTLGERWTVGSGDDDGDGVGELLDRMRVLADLAPRPIARAATTADPIVIADELLDRWQRSAARRGQLLTIEVVRVTEGAVTADWDAIVGAAEVLLATFVDRRGHGALQVELMDGEDIGLRVSHDGPLRTGRDHGDAAKRLAAAVSIVRGLVDPLGGVVVSDTDGAWRVEVRLPMGE